MVVSFPFPTAVMLTKAVAAGQLDVTAWRLLRECNRLAAAELAWQCLEESTVRGGYFDPIEERALGVQRGYHPHAHANGCRPRLRDSRRRQCCE